MKQGAILTRVAALVVTLLLVTVLDNRLYSLPEQVRVLFSVNLPAGAPGNNNDNKVSVMIRRCGKYASRTGMWWWQRTQVDFKACAYDAATEGERKVIGEFPPGGNAPPILMLFTFGCVYCGPRHLTSVRIPFGAASEQASGTLKLPVDLRLEPDELLQLMYVPRTDQPFAPGTQLTIGVPDME